MCGIERMKDVLDTRPVPMSEQKELILKAKAGDRFAFERLLGAVFLYIVREAKRTSSWRHEVEVDDLITHGMLGVQHAVKKFDVERPIRFLTYAGWWIRQYQRRYVQSLGLVRQPSHRFTGDTLEEALVMDSVTYLEGGLDEGVTMDAALAAAGFTEENFERDVENKIRLSRLLAASARLSPRLRFALEATLSGEMTLSEAGEKLSLTRERVRQLRVEAIVQVQDHLAASTSKLDVGKSIADFGACITPGCGKPNYRKYGGGAMRCPMCFDAFVSEARRAGGKSAEARR